MRTRDRGGMGIIDSHSDYSLYDIVNGDLGFADLGNGYEEPEGTVTVQGLHIFPANDKNRYNVQLDGHVGLVDTFESTEFDDVLELVDYLLTHLAEINHREGDREALVDYAGKLLVTDKDKAADSELYEYAPL